MLGAVHADHRSARDCQGEAQRDVGPFQAILQNAMFEAGLVRLFFQTLLQLDFYRPARRFVRAAFRAAAKRWPAVLPRAATCACLEIARLDAA